MRKNHRKTGVVSALYTDEPPMNSPSDEAITRQRDSVKELRQTPASFKKAVVKEFMEK